MKIRATYFCPKRSGFTMIEIAISLAVIGIALTAIIGVLPIGMNVQRENREATVINQDATIFMEDIRNGAQHADDLTNYVYQVEVGTTNSVPFTSGAQIIGLLTTPGVINHAYVHSISGPAVEKPPQINNIIVGDSFSYRIVCENIPVKTADNSGYSQKLTNNLHELRLTFLWPIFPNGAVGKGRQTFRALVAGQIVQTNVAGNNLYFFQSQSFTNAP